jgi:hypothetical protein
MQQLHLTDYIWQIFCRDVKPSFERPNIATHSSTASPSPQQPPPETAPASILQDEPSTMNIVTTPAEATTMPEPGPQESHPTCSSEASQPPQPLYATSPATSTPDQQPTYASVLQRLKPSLSQSTPKIYQSEPSLKSHSQSKTLTDVSTTNHHHSSSTRRPARVQLVELATKTHLPRNL